MSGSDLSEFYETFFDEAQELLQDMEQHLLNLDLNQPDREALNAIFRSTHSIKGGAATFGAFDLLVKSAHKLENVLDQIRNDELALSQHGVDLFLRGKDVLSDQVDAYRNNSSPDEHTALALLEELDRLEKGISAPLESSSARPSSSEVLRITFIKVSSADLEALQQELAMMGDVTAIKQVDEESIYELASDLDADSVRAVCGFIINDDQMRIEATLGKKPVEPLSDSPLNSKKEVDPNKTAPSSDKKPTPKPAGKESQTIRVPTDRVDTLVNQVGEVVINQSILNQACLNLNPTEHAELLQGLEQMETALRTLQESVMALRMVPMDYAFGRYPRVVRETASKLGKQIEFKAHGGATELDKGLIEKLIDPLTHLVRNSMDHGVETPDVRASKGKDPRGLIQMAAYHEGGRIIVKVSDDGAGINRRKIIDKAIEKGQDASHDMSDDQAFMLIFQPGFSTATEVTDVSGRGVGMDVVRRNIQSIGGQIQVKSAPDKGTEIFISLPLTLAIMDGMSMQCGDERFVIALSDIVECLQPSQEQIHTLSNDAKVLSLRGEHLPILYLSSVFDIHNTKEDIFEAILVVIRTGATQYALAVDQLLGQHQVVVKSLETHYDRVEGLSGATILGDGSVALIIDAAALPLCASNT